MINVKRIFKWNDGEKYILNYLNNLNKFFGKYEYNKIKNNIMKVFD